MNNKDKIKNTIEAYSKLTLHINNSLPAIISTATQEFFAAHNDPYYNEATVKFSSYEGERQFSIKEMFINGEMKLDVTNNKKDIIIKIGDKCHIKGKSVNIEALKNGLENESSLIHFKKCISNAIEDTFDFSHAFQEFQVNTNFVYPDNDFNFLHVSSDYQTCIAEVYIKVCGDSSTEVRDEL